MSTILHISDTHFGTEIEKSVSALIELHQQLNPELVILSGDITQRAHRSQFLAAQQFMERLNPTHALVLPGNHDIPLFNLYRRLTGPYANYCERFGDDLEPEFESDDLLVIGVNTTRVKNVQAGEISGEQIAAVEKRLLSAHPRQLRCVVTHQPIHIVATSDQKNLLTNAEEAVRRWAAAGVDLIFGGHVHLPFVRSVNERYPGIGRPVWAVQAGTATSHRVRGSVPNSVNVVCYDSARSCVVQQWDYSKTNDAFTEFSSKKIELYHGLKPHES